MQTVRYCTDTEEVTSSLTSGLDVLRSIQIGILVIVFRLLDDNDDDDDDDNNNNNSIQSFRYYLCAGITATRPNTQTVQEYKENTKIEAANEITHQKCNKKSHLRITA
jgi:hypothetical protein